MFKDKKQRAVRVDIGWWGSRQVPVLFHIGYGHFTKGDRSEPESTGIGKFRFSIMLCYTKREDVLILPNFLIFIDDKH